MIYNLKITVRLDNDPSCNLYTLIENVEYSFLPSASQIKDAIEATKRRFVDSYPHRQGKPTMYSPVEVETKEVHDEAMTKEVFELNNQGDAMTLLKEAYSSGQLQGTMIGDKLRKFFGVNYTEVLTEKVPYVTDSAHGSPVGPRHSA